MFGGVDEIEKSNANIILDIRIKWAYSLLIGDDMTARELLRTLHHDGWYDVDQEGSHLQLKHPTKPGKITIPMHSGRDIAPGTLNNILKCAGLK